MKYLLLMICFVACADRVMAQMDVSFTAAFEDLKTTKAAWEIQIINPSQPSYVELEVVIRDEQQVEYYRAITNTFEVQTGITQLTYNSVNHINVLTELQTDTVELAENSYTFMVFIRDGSTNQVLGLTSKQKIIVQNAGENPKPKIIQNLSGSLHLKYYYQQHSYQQSEYQPQYFLSEATMSSDFLSIPVQLRWLLSNNNAGYRQPFRQIKVSVDVNKVKQQKKDQLIRLLSEREAQLASGPRDSLNRLKKRLVDFKYPDLPKWKEQLQAGDYTNLKKDLSKIDKIDQALDNPTLKKNRQKLNSLKEKYKVVSETDLKDVNNKIPADSLKKMKRLFALEKQTSKLEAEKDSLKKIRKKLNRLEKLASKVKKAENKNLSDLIDDPNQLPEALAFIQPKEKGFKALLSGIQALQIGSTYPYYSKHVLSSLRVDGLDISHLSHSNLFKEITLGQAKYQSINSLSSQPSYYYPQYMLGCKVGAGGQEESHIHLFYVYFFDRTKNTNGFTPESGLLRKTACQNVMAGADFQIIAFENNLRLGGEVETSLFTPDRNAPKRKKRQDEILLIPFAQDLLRQETVIGYSGKLDLKATLNNRTTDIKGMVDYYGPGYHSLGVVKDYQDLLRYNFKLNQVFFKKSLKMSMFYQKDFDHLNAMQAIDMTITTCYGLSLGFSHKKYPSITIDYRPYYQQKSTPFDSTHRVFLPKGQLIQFIGNYVFHFKRTTFQTQFGGNIQFCNYLGNQNSGIFTYLINEVITRNPFSFTLSGNYTPEIDLNGQPYENQYLNSCIQITLKRKYPVALGYSINVQGQGVSRKSSYLRLAMPIYARLLFETTILYNQTTPKEISFYNSGMSGWCALKISL